MLRNTQLSHLMTGSTRWSSSSAVSSCAPGRVDCPPTSTIAAPSETILLA